MRNLTNLALKWRTDKLFRHSYIPFYEELFKDRVVKNLLEIGIGYKDLMEPFVEGYIDGASIYMWSEYFPDANIYTCDIREDILINSGNIKSFVCDQSSSIQLLDLMVKINAKLDVIIDDGSHAVFDQILSAQTLLPFLNEGGVYVIEDAQDPSAIMDAAGSMDALQVSPHLLGKTWDDNLIVIRR